jgi:2-polyprenyl-6-methoxyphenol hydroxylase-like FAD-dependent oxidoreductase
MSTSGLHVLVIGGGIAGLCLAQGLRQAGVSVAVFERDRSRTDRLEGFRLHVNPAGSRALHTCLPAEVWSSFVASSGASANLRFLTQQLKELLVVQDESGRPDTPGSERAYAVAWRLPLTDSARAWLPPRLSASMNMIVAPAPYFLFTSAFDPGDATPASGRYGLCAFVARRAAYPPGVHDLNPDGLRRVVEPLIAGWHPVLRRLLAEADPESVMLVQHLTSVPVPAWPSTNITLIGDAIHAMPPVGGLGGNAALRDANLLARLLVEADRGRRSLRPAIAAYETEMREYGFAAVRTALRAQN